MKHRAAIVVNVMLGAFDTTSASVGGAHTCIGMQLALGETEAFLHALTRRCRFELVDPGEQHHAFAPFGTVTGNLPLRVTPLA